MTHTNLSEVLSIRLGERCRIPQAEAKDTMKAQADTGSQKQLCPPIGGGLCISGDSLSLYFRAFAELRRNTNLNRRWK